jgi:hypothetical protein
MKIRIHIKLNSLNNFQLINKGDFLMIKVLKLRSEVKKTNKVSIIIKIQITKQNIK